MPKGLCTLTRLVVQVSVLSEPIIQQLPKVLTEGRLRTRAFFPAIWHVLRAHQVMITRVRPSEMVVTPDESAIF